MHFLYFGNPPALFFQATQVHLFNSVVRRSILYFTHIWVTKWI